MDGCRGFAIKSLLPQVMAVLFSTLRGLQIMDLIRETPEKTPVLSLPSFSLGFLEIQPKAY